MSGFESFNSQGFRQFSSEAGRKTLIAGATQSTSQPYQLAASVGHAYWARLTRGGACCLLHRVAPRGNIISVTSGTGYFKLATNRSANASSGYLDVYDANGVLNWSAASQPSMPNIQGVFSVSAAQAVSGTGGAYLDDDIWVCMSAAHVFDTSMAMVGLELIRTSDGIYRLRGRYMGYSASSLQEGLASTIYLPYARFSA